MSRIRAAFAEHPMATTVVVVIGALVLTTVAAVLLLGLLGTRDGVAEASPSASPSSEAPSASAPTDPSPSEPVASPSEEPLEEVVYGDPFAIEAVVETPLAGGPGEDSPIASLGAGDVGLISDGPLDVDGVEWFNVQYGEAYGWISADTATVIFHRRVAQNVPVQLIGIDGGPIGFIAWGADTHRTDAPMRAITAVSHDGRSWQVGRPPVAGPGEIFSLHATGGPSGWLLMGGNVEGTALGGAWLSDDGTSWEPISVTTTDGGDLSMVPIDLVGHANGYALMVRDDASGTSRHRILSSPDGRTWDEMDWVDSGSTRIGPAGTGFAAWTEDANGRLVIRYSPDGEAWLAPSADAGALPSGFGTMVSTAQSVMLAVTTDLETGLRTWWTTELTPSSFGSTWTPQPAVAEQLADAGIIQILQAGPDAMLALGRTVGDGSRQVWRSMDGIRWGQAGADDLLAETNASLGLAAGGDAGIAVVGYVTTDAGPNPLFLHASDRENWTADDGNAIAVTDSSVIGACPAPPTTFVELLAVPGPVGAECFGDEAIDFLAWRTEPGGCGGFSPGIYEPEWLASPFAFGGIVLTPFEAASGGCGDGAIPPAAGDLADVQQWVEVSGHWADPASDDCRFRPDPMAITDALWPDLVFHCRTVFVVSEAVPAGLAP